MLFWETDKCARDYEDSIHKKKFGKHWDNAHPIIKKLVMLGKLYRTEHDPIPWKTLDIFYGTELDIDAEFNVNFSNSQGFSFSWRCRDKTGLRESFKGKSPEKAFENLVKVCEWLEGYGSNVQDFRYWLGSIERKYFKKYFVFWPVFFCILHSRGRFQDRFLFLVLRFRFLSYTKLF
nr:hypothetical protein MarQu_091 [Marseillevirus sp.]